ncbi:lipocalin-like domain-containing protein [Phenylobacterium terrae]|uniref:Lipocalin-like domain-containing protein n=1 Tax=Phenylobacterium terrae TaxID=2665495 RepID=A0ABW4MXN2_9CAUL
MRRLLLALAVLALAACSDPDEAAEPQAENGSSPALPAAVGGAPADPPQAGGDGGFAPVTPGRPLSFPADHGAHPAFRTEWWYVTGWLQDERGRPLGFQVTFFRSRTGADPANPSLFSPQQVLFAHAAVSDPEVGRLIHDQRIARAGFGLAEAKVGDADLVIDDWRLWRAPDGSFRTTVGGEAFALTLTLAPTQPELLQGEAGFSRKGPQASQASWYYSLPQLKAAGELRRGRQVQKVTGQAWLDREWSSTLLDPRAVGWDWTGLNLPDGGALMAFQVRDAQGGALWAGGSLRTADGRIVRFAPQDVRFAPLRRWRSPRTGGVYPVEQEVAVRTPEGERRWRLSPLMDDQELDSRASGGPIYWEGAVTSQDGARGYLELTGYVGTLRL